MRGTWDTQSGAESTGGARRDRTDDLMLAKHALSQLSYGPLAPTLRFSTKGPCLGLKRRRRHPSAWLARHQARRPFGLWSVERVVMVEPRREVSPSSKSSQGEEPPAPMRGA